MDRRGGGGGGDPGRVSQGVPPSSPTSCTALYRTVSQTAWVGDRRTRQGLKHGGGIQRTVQYSVWECGKWLARAAQVGGRSRRLHDRDRDQDRDQDRDHDAGG
jgi:hypothetical protein